MIRSLGGWDELKKMRLTGQDRIKSDQRILGDSDFVQEVLSDSEEIFTRKYELKSRGFTFEKVLDRVSLLFQLDKQYIIGKGRQMDRVRARDLVCYWCATELGISMANLAKRFRMTPGAVSYAVKRGEQVANEAGYRLDG